MSFRMQRVFFLIITLFTLTECSPVDIVNALTPTKSIRSIETFQYAAGKRQSLDIYTPKDPKADAPILVFIHGGGWDSGDKSDYKFLAATFTSAGYSIAVPNYRLYPEVIYPDIVEDAARAVSWTRDHFNGRPIILMGHSAGAHSAIMLALETSFLADQGVDRCAAINAAIGLSGPYGIVELTEEPHISIFPDRFTGEDAPLNIATQTVPPILLATGMKDDDVYPQNSIALAQELTGQGASVELITYPDLDHVDTVKLLSYFFEDDGILKQDVLAFLDKREGVQAPFCN